MLKCHATSKSGLQMEIVPTCSSAEDNIHDMKHIAFIAVVAAHSNAEHDETSRNVQKREYPHSSTGLVSSRYKKLDHHHIFRNLSSSWNETRKVTEVANIFSPARKWAKENGSALVENAAKFCEVVNIMQINFRKKILTTNGPWYDFVPVKFCNLLDAPAGRMVKKTLE